MAAGAVVDILLLPRTKQAVYDRMLGYWVTLSDTSYRNVARLLARYLIALGGRYVPGSIWSVKGIIFWTAVSWILTSLIGAVDSLVFDRAAYPLNSFPVPLPEFPVYLANWICDLCTFLITLSTLRIVRDRSPVRGAFALLLNLLFATVLYVACLFAATCGTYYSDEYRLPGSAYPVHAEEMQVRRAITSRGEVRFDIDKATVDYAGSAPRDSWLDVARSFELIFSSKRTPNFKRYVVRATRDGVVYQDYVMMERPVTRLYLFSCSTVFVPSSFLMIVLLALFAYKLCMQLYRKVMMYILERLTQPVRPDTGFMPITLLSAVGVLFEAVAKSVVDLSAH